MNPKSKEVLAAAMKGHTIRDAVIIAAGLALLQVAGKLEKPKEPIKPKFKPAVHPRLAAKPGEARELSRAAWFIDLCSEAGISTTVRQASKYLQKRGAAYTFKHRKS